MMELGELIEMELACRYRQRDARERANRRLDEFLSTIGHELRSPLSAILSAVQLTRQTGLDQEQIQWSHGVIERQSRQLVRMIDDLLDVSRLAMGRIELREQFVRLADIVARAVSEVRPTLDQKRHELVIAIEAPALHLEADPARLEQILVNLLMNAIKLTEQPGRIEIAATRLKGSIRITVSDTGMGISRDRLSEIFDIGTEA